MIARSRYRSFTLVLAMVLPTVLLVAQQRDVSAPPRPGTGEISGAVMSAESNPQPLRRAVVTLTGVGNPRSVLTDDAGRFTFGKLAAGTYNVTARKAAYIAAPYGAKRPGRTGMPIALKDGQRSDITISMFRGAAIGGTLRDAAGRPVRGVDVRAIDTRTLLVLDDSSPPLLATSDDRGMYRIFGLLPGDYYIAALPMSAGAGAVLEPSSAANDAALAMLAARRGVSGPAPTPSSAAPASHPIGFAPVYFPGSPSYQSAAGVHVEAGEDHAGVDFELRPLPMAAIEGTVRGDIANLSGIQVSIIPSGPRVSTVMSSNSLSGRPMDAQGRFRYSNLAPGSYRLVARARVGAPAAPTTPSAATPVSASGGGRGGSGNASGGESLYGFADVELNGQDLSGIDLVLRPGGTIAGRIVFAGTGTTAKPADLTKLRLSLALENGTGGMVNSGGMSMGSGLISYQPTVNADGTFEIRSIGPGRFRMDVGGDVGTWKLRSALAPSGTFAPSNPRTLAPIDLLDDAIDLGPGIDLRDVVITLSDARTELSGTLQTPTGEITTEYTIVALPADRALWRPKSRRILSVRPGTDGRFVFADPPAGEYVVAAMTDLDPLDLTDTTFLEQIAAAGGKVTVVEGQTRVQDLKIVRSPGSYVRSPGSLDPGPQ